MTTNTETTTSVVDARFAGGPIFVDVDGLPHDPEQPIVRVRIPGLDLALFRHEAADLGIALLARAGDVREIEEQKAEAGR